MMVGHRGSAALLAFASMFVGCDSEVDEPIPEIPRVGAAYSLPNSSRVVLVSQSADRFAVLDLEDGSFTPPSAVIALQPPGVPFRNGGAETSEDGDATYFWDVDGDGYYGYDYSTGLPVPPPIRSFLVQYPGCVLPGGIGAALEIGSFRPNREGLYLFSGDGLSYRVWNYSRAQCEGGLVEFASSLGAGAPITSVGAAFYADIPSDIGYYMFDRDGTSFTVYRGGGVFEAARPTTDLGDGTLRFDDG